MAVEKYLKTFLVFKNQDFPKTHNLDILLKNCSDLNAEFAALDMGNLEDFAVRGRYPHDFIIPDAAETLNFYQIALDVKALVLKAVIIS
jgi:HEPN domain-containing protein